MLLWPQGIVYPLTATLILYGLSMFPFAVLAVSRDPVVGMLSPFYLSVRAASLGLDFSGVSCDRNAGGPGHDGTAGAGTGIQKRLPRLSRRVRHDRYDQGWEGRCDQRRSNIAHVAGMDVRQRSGNAGDREPPGPPGISLRRKGKRGAGEWERITWEEAIEGIASRLTKFEGKRP